MPRENADAIQAEEDLGHDLYVLGKRKTLLFDIEGYVDAVPLFLQALEVSVNDPLIYSAMAETYSYWGRRREINGQECLSYYNLAYDYARQALSLGSDLSESHRAMAVALRGGELCDAQARKREARRAMELNPYDGENCWEFWRAHGRGPDDPLIFKAIALSPLLCGAHNDLGVSLCEHGRLDEAVFHLEAALRLSPRNSLFQYNLSMICFRKGRLIDAGRILSASANMHPKDSLVLSGMELVRAEAREEILST
jgi:tetratricopeptide (TPR) repeat protein